MNGIATKLGIGTDSLTELLAGRVPNEVASKMESNTAVLQDFVDGKVHPDLIWSLGGPPEDVQRLRDAVGREGAIGILIGLLAK